jgi:hypothetical protein
MVFELKNARYPPDPSNQPPPANGRLYAFAERWEQRPPREAPVREARSPAAQAESSNFKFGAISAICAAMKRWMPAVVLISKARCKTRSACFRVR